MTLATRCPACSTTFKVVRDQLRLADGWVRCGRCDEVFLAADALALVDPSIPPQAPARSLVPGAQTLPGSAPSSRIPGTPALEQKSPPQTLPTAVTHSEPEPPETEPLVPKPAGDAAPEPLGTQPLEDLPEPIPAASAAATRYVWDSATPAPTPRSPWATAAWGVAAVAGVAGLGIQAAVAWHDELAHAAPGLKPVLEVACVMADCRVEPIRRLQALSVEASQLSQLGGTIYQFNATIRNRSEDELAVPALDLVLTGSDGQVLVRKVLRWTDFGLRGRSMAAQQELSLQTKLNTGSTAVAGFTIELFYP